MKVKILDKFWELRFVSNLGKDASGETIKGDCDSPKTPGKVIRILSRIKGETLLDALIHEFTHAADWNKDEEYVEKFASDLARFLMRMGYSRDE